MKKTFLQLQLHPWPGGALSAIQERERFGPSLLMSSFASLAFFRSIFGILVIKFKSTWYWSFLQSTLQSTRVEWSRRDSFSTADSATAFLVKYRSFLDACSLSLSFAYYLLITYSRTTTSYARFRSFCRSIT